MSMECTRECFIPGIFFWERLFLDNTEVSCLRFCILDLFHVQDLVVCRSIVVWSKKQNLPFPRLTFWFDLTGACLVTQCFKTRTWTWYRNQSRVNSNSDSENQTDLISVTRITKKYIKYWNFNEKNIF